MTEITIHAAKTNLSKLIERARTGEEIIITRGKEPVARLLGVKPSAPGRRFGAMKGELFVGDEFFEPLPDDELALWEGEEE